MTIILQLDEFMPYYLILKIVFKFKVKKHTIMVCFFTIINCYCLPVKEQDPELF